MNNVKEKLSCYNSSKCLHEMHFYLWYLRWSLSFSIFLSQRFAEAVSELWVYFVLFSACLLYHPHHTHKKACLVPSSYTITWRVLLGLQSICWSALQSSQTALHRCAWPMHLWRMLPEMLHVVCKVTKTDLPRQYRTGGENIRVWNKLLSTRVFCCAPRNY